MLLRSLVALLFLSPIWVHAQTQQLTLGDFLQIVERSHPALQSANYEPDLAEAEIRSALGRFDPVLSFRYDSKVKSGDDKVMTMDGSVELPLDMMFGPKIKADFKRGQGFQIDPESLTSPAGEASFGFALPLFQGIFTDTRRNALRKAMLRPDIARAQYRIERNALLRSAAMKYWDWCEAVEQRKVADTLVEIAKVRLDYQRRISSAGEKARIDTIEVLQEVLRREGERIGSTRLEQQAYIDLIGFIWNPSQPTISSTYTSEPLPERASPSVNLDSAKSLAMALRPEVKRASLMVETMRFDSSLAQEYMRPFVEFNAGFISYDVAKSAPLDYNLGLRVQQPLLFRQASAQLETSSIAVDRAEITATLIQRIIEIDADNAVISYSRSRERVETAAAEVAAARAMVNAELQRFQAGDSSILVVNLRERFLSEALQRLVSAKADVMKARISLLWATGLI